MYVISLIFFNNRLAHVRVPFLTQHGSLLSNCGSWYVNVTKELDIDKPRNSAKRVTVEWNA